MHTLTQYIKQCRYNFFGTTGIADYRKGHSSRKISFSLCQSLTGNTPEISFTFLHKILRFQWRRLHGALGARVPSPLLQMSGHGGHRE